MSNPKKPFGGYVFEHGNAVSKNRFFFFDSGTISLKQLQKNLRTKLYLVKFIRLANLYLGKNSQQF